PNFFAAARKVSAALPGVNFTLCGEGMNEQNSEVLEMIQRNGLADKTLLLGQRDDMYDIFPAFDINTLSSLFEGFPNVLGEAMACGVPCVATDVGDSAYIIGDTGRVVAPGNPEALAQAWLELLSMPSEEMLQLGAEARKRIEEKFSISKVTRQYESFYLDLLK
ncbi:MAG: glycosyltransferase, partial [Pseudomonadota bacterium]